MKIYINLLKSNHIIKRLSSVQLIVYFGAWFSNIAIYTLLLELKVDERVIAFVAMLHFLSGVLQAPLSGAIIDSFKPKKLLMFLIVVQFFATLGFLVVDSISHLWLLYIFVFIKMAAASFYFTTEMSLLPKLLNDDELKTANELHSIIWSLTYTLGMTLGGFAVYLFGVKIAFVLDSLMFVVAFFMLTKLDIEFIEARVKEKILSMMVDVFRYLKNHPKALHMMFLHAIVGFSAYDALIALVVDKYYASIIAISLAMGFLNASRAIGLVIGPMVLSRFINNLTLFYLFVAQGLAIMLWALVMQNFYISLIASVFVGFFNTTLWSYTYTLLQKNIDSNYYGRVVAYNDMFFLGTASFVSYMIGFLAHSGFSLEAIALIIGSIFMVGGFYYIWVLKTQEIR
ncbi:MAG: MFS transporter [Sulfurimonadaceae bacterium]|jgi:MFS family permease|nr:MFS transporter [Sulfurimonadaceae bacterium]